MNASTICSLVIPYLASPGLSIISVPREKTPPGLNLQDITSGMSATSFKKSICVISSRFIVALSFLAYWNSLAGVSLDENIISSFLNPHLSDIISSVNDEQSTPHPSSWSTFNICGFGVALTAKYSLNPLFHEKACLSFLAFSLIPFSS